MWPAAAFDTAGCTARNTVERGIGRLKRHRAVALRTDKRLFVYIGTVKVANIDIWLHDLTQNLQQWPRSTSAYTASVTS